MKTFEIYFDDLSTEAQDNYLKFTNVKDESDLNHEYIPIAIIDLEEEDD